MTQTSGTTDFILGYYGYSNTPPCVLGTCYYAKWDPFYITEEVLNVFKNSGHGMNVRNANQGTHAQFQMQGKGIFNTISNPHDIVGK